MEKVELRTWVAEETARLEPPSGWEADTARAVVRFRRRAEERPVWRRWPGWAGAAVVAGGLVLGAQQFWQYLTVPPKVAFIRVNSWPEGVPSPKVQLQAIPIPPIPARDAAEAGARVRYEVRLPRSAVLSGSPRLSTVLPLTVGMTVKTADLELALRKSGVSDVVVPKLWDGAQVALHTSAVVLAEWPDVVLAQSLPLTMSAPAGFDFAEFSALVLRVMGVGPAEAQELARQMETTPAWLAPIDREFMPWATIERVSLTSGVGTVVMDPRSRKVRMVWSAADRVYGLEGKISRELAIAVANAVY
jgi:hypothetical protein